MQVVSNLVDRSSVKAEKLGASITRQLQQTSDRIAVQTEASQDAFQVWHVLSCLLFALYANRY